MCVGERGGPIISGREMQRLKTVGGSPPPQKSRFFVAWNHCIISEKTERTGAKPSWFWWERRQRGVRHSLTRKCGALIAVSSSVLRNLSLVSRLPQTAKVYESLVSDYLGELLVATAAAVCTYERTFASEIHAEFFATIQIE